LAAGGVPSHVQIPAFILRKLYRSGSLRETGDGRFAFALKNVLGSATITQPPVVVVNGIGYRPENVDAGPLKLETISEAKPWEFHKGQEVTLHVAGRLLRGANRIHILVRTKEFGDLEVYVEDKEAEYCEIPGTDAAQG
jgi:hypothetical protein